MAISPAAELIARGNRFALDGELYHVEDRYPATTGSQADVLVARGAGLVQRQVRRAFQLRDLEAWISQGRVFFPDGPYAEKLIARDGWVAGWCELSHAVLPQRGNRELAGVRS